MTETKKFIDSDETSKTVVQSETELTHQELNSAIPVAFSMKIEQNTLQIANLDESFDPDCMNVETSHDIEREKMIGAGVTAGVFTLMLGPIIATAVGFGVAYGTKSSGATGDVCRAVGDVGLSIREKAIHLNEKHNLVGKTKESAANAAKIVKDAEERKHFFANVKVVVADSWENLVQFEKKHNILQRTREGIGHALSVIGNKMKGNTSQEA